MGLFDNLFLDKNTPMAINTGEKPLVDAQVLSTGTSGSGSGTTGSATVGGTTGDSSGQPATGQSTNVSSQAGGGFLQMMESSIPDSSSPSSGAQFLSSTGPVQDSSVTSPVTNTTSSDIPASFDIGGFDMASPGLSISSDASAPSSDASIQVVSSVPSQNASEVSFIVTADSSVQLAAMGVESDSAISVVSVVSEAPQDAPEIKETSSSLLNLSETHTVDSSPSVGILGTASPSQNVPEKDAPATEGSILTESPLTTLMSGFSTPAEVSSSSSPNPPNDMSPQNPSDESKTLVDEKAPAIDSLFSLTETASVESIEKEIPSIDTIVEESNSLSSLSSSETLSQPTDSDTGHPMSQIGKELARMTRSPRLQGKLTGFITELEELSQEEERLKDEKRKQIESYKLRIEELKKEYETRIHALELEEADLKKQISVMDEERQHITQVIEGFKQELEVV